MNIDTGHQIVKEIMATDSENTDEIDWKPIGRRLDEAITRQRGHRKRSAFAYEMGVDSSRMARFCWGDERPPVELLMRMAKVLDISLDWLMFGRLPSGTRQRTSRSEIRQELDEFLDQIPDLVLERILWQAKALHTLGKIGPEAFPDYVRRVRGE